MRETPVVAVTAVHELALAQALIGHGPAVFTARFWASHAAWRREEGWQCERTSSGTRT